MTLSFDFIGDSLGTCGALVINPINGLTGRPVKSDLTGLLSFARASLVQC